MTNNSHHRYKLLPGIKKKLLYYNFFIILLFAIFINCSVSEFFSIMIENGYTKLNFNNILVEIISILFFSVIFHEIGHAIFIIVLGYDIRLLMAGPLMLINENGKFKLKIRINKFLTGGVTLPDMIKKVTNKREYAVLNRNYIMILLAGSVINFIFIIISMIMISFRFQLEIAFILYMVNLAFIIMGMFYGGDVYKSIELKMNPSDIIIFLVPNLILDYWINDFYLDEILHYVEIMLANRKFNYKLLVLLDPLIEYYCIHNKSIPREIQNFIDWIIQDYKSIKESKNILINIKIINLITNMINYHMVSKEKVRELNIKMRETNQQLHKIFMEFESYSLKKELVNNIRLSEQ